jgi:hypothetical protein
MPRHLTEASRLCLRASIHLWALNLLHGMLRIDQSNSNRLTSGKSILSRLRKGVQLSTMNP